MNAMHQKMDNKILMKLCIRVFIIQCMSIYHTVMGKNEKRYIITIQNDYLYFLMIILTILIGV